MTTRPRRKKLDDRLLYAGIPQEEMMCDMALAPFDRAARDMEYKWGVDTLQELVSPETAARYGSALSKLNDAINQSDSALVAARAAVCIRGLAAMDAEATQAGKQPASDDVLICEIDGQQFGILHDNKGWPRAQDKHPGLPILSRREAAIAVRVYRKTALAEMTEETKKAFKDASIRTARIHGEDPSDPIPF
jgi:hypothetical protein